MAARAARCQFQGEGDLLCLGNRIGDKVLVAKGCTLVLENTDLEGFLFVQFRPLVCQNAITIIKLCCMRVVGSWSGSATLFGCWVTWSHDATF
jgi:hypothetical protein